MTRSMEIPDAAVKDAFRAIQARWHAPLPLTYLDMVAGLQAALPYLVPATGAVVTPRDTCPHGDPACPCPDGDMCHYEGPDPMSAPAGDGGLREALAEQAGIWEGYTSDNPDVATGFELAAGKLRYLLAAHPAAPAVPQPIERAVCNACGWEGEPVHDICPACRQDTLNYFTPASGSAVPQPIEREALVEVLADELAGWMDVTPSSRWEVAKSLAGRVLAVLAGEQEQDS